MTLTEMKRMEQTGEAESLFFAHEFNKCQPQSCPFCNRLTKTPNYNQSLVGCFVQEWGVDPNGLRFK